ncbi:hypothetical protein J1N35_007114 [Gossypium stocksii]|uniref:Uncharacterized protein n=1 Tax=Gossypium stocksii TaxID=47602 RepID=A0A9D3W638_9ROSI|nr:hypothetical protein J1N35_007114 [Gossypium stocksii]
MAINLILPDEITTLAQKEKVDRMMREVQDYRMTPEEGIVQHFITMEKLVVRKLPREFIYSIPVIKMKEEEDPEEFPNWIVKDEVEENLELNIENFPGEDTESEME